MHSVDASLLAKVLGREHSLFAADLRASAAELQAAVAGRRILVIGAAGSIGAAFVQQVAALRPAALHLLDLNENGLVEVVRELRSSNTAAPDDFRTYSIGIGSPEFSSFIAAGFPYDTVVNFAALKHVRAERDPFSMMRMLQTNVVSLDDTLQATAALDHVEQYFSVSSDKSVNPASAMGASKALMEDVLWQHAERYRVSSARFANVAFSAGSLLESFLQRLDKRQPLAAPTDVRRFFISHEEAGELCLLGTFLAGNRQVVFPNLDPQEDMQTFADIALTVLDHFGLNAEHCASDAEARARAAHLPATGATSWPVYFAATDTSGEKMYEEFFTADDEVDTQRWHNVGLLSCAELSAQRQATLQRGLDELRGLANAGHYTRARLLDVIKRLEPSLTHVDTGADLDAKM